MNRERSRAVPPYDHGYDDHADYDYATGETLNERIARLKPYWESPRFALTVSDIVDDYRSGQNRYAR